jgi:hypothetical protein
MYGLFFITGLLDSPGPPDLSNYLQVGQLAHWLMGVNLPLSSDLQNLLFQRLFESALKHSSSLHQLQDAMPVLQKHSSSHSHDLSALGSAVIFLQVLSKVTCCLRRYRQECRIGLFKANGY